MTGAPRPAGPQVQLAVLASLLVAVAAALGTGWGSPSGAALPGLAVGVAATELAVAHLQLGRQRWTFSLTEAVLGAAYVVAPGGWVVLAVGIGVALAQGLRRQPALKLSFNVAQLSAAAGVGALVARLCGGGVVGACVGLLSFWAVNYVLVAVVVALTSAQPLRALLGANAGLSALHAAGNSSIGLLAAHLAVTEPAGLTGLLVPLGLLWVTYDQQARRAAEARLYAELARGQEQAAERSPDASAQVVLTAAARLLGDAEVEMVLLAADGPVRYAGDVRGVPHRARADRGAFDEPWVLRALGSGPVATGREDGRPWCSAVLGEPDAPLAVLLARRPQGAEPFRRGDAQVARVLASQAQAWLAVSELSARQRAADEPDDGGEDGPLLGELGALTAPALTVLRESTARLERLAQRSSGVEAIVEELHLVERAVASLLGAVTLAAQPELLVDLVPAPSAPRTETPARRGDWTTTGVAP